MSVTIQVDAGAGQHAISPLIYGLNNADQATLSYLNVPFNRSGGNLSSTYNWQQDASNTANDYFFESLSRGNGTPAKSSDQFISSTLDAGAQPTVTIPTLGFVAKLGSGRSPLASYSVAKYGAQNSTDPFWADAGNGILKNGNPVPGNVKRCLHHLNVAFQQAWVQHMVATFGSANSGGAVYAATTNRSIWFATHKGRGSQWSHHGSDMQDIIDYGSMIKSVVPQPQVQGGRIGFDGIIYSGSRSTIHSDTTIRLVSCPYVPWRRDISLLATAQTI